jgi:3'(2'), 5'-bisphosphate nucleotidase
MKVDRQDVLTALLEIARGAEQLVMRVYTADDMGAELKGPNDPVTRADREANAYILERLQARFPTIPIVAEESDPASFAGFASSPVAFFVDPVDGTHDFIAKNGEFCIMIGFAEDGQATVGVVLCPAYEGISQTYGAAVGFGAFRYFDDGTRKPLRIACESDPPDLSRVRCVVSRFHRSPHVEARLASLAVQELRPLGSAGIKAIAVASGQVELYAHPSGTLVKLWDACAPNAIVTAAGGSFTDAHGVPFDYQGAVTQGQGTLVAHPSIHQAALKRLEAFEQRERTP